MRDAQTGITTWVLYLIVPGAYKAAAINNMFRF